MARHWTMTSSLALSSLARRVLCLAAAAGAAGTMVVVVGTESYGIESRAGQSGAIMTGPSVWKVIRWT